MAPGHRAAHGGPLSTEWGLNPRLLSCVPTSGPVLGAGLSGSSRLWQPHLQASSRIPQPPSHLIGFPAPPPSDPSCCCVCLQTWRGLLPWRLPEHRVHLEESLQSPLQARCQPGCCTLL